MKKCLEARDCKAAICQNVLLEIYPRLASFIDTNGMLPFHNVFEVVDHSLSIVSKYPDAMLTLGLLALSRPQEIRPKIAHILNMLVQHIQSSLAK